MVPECVELQEMICESCMNKNPFLWTYADHLAGSSSPFHTPLTHLSTRSHVVSVSCCRSSDTTFKGSDGFIHQPLSRLTQEHKASPKTIISG